MRTIEELKREQEKSVKNSKYKLIDHNMENLKSQLFDDKFYFYVKFTPKNNPWLFNLYIYFSVSFFVFHRITQQQNNSIS